MIVYLARDIPAFVMYCVNGKSCSSLRIESTDSMIRTYMFSAIGNIWNLESALRNFEIQKTQANLEISQKAT